MTSCILNKSYALWGTTTQGSTNISDCEACMAPPRWYLPSIKPSHGLQSMWKHHTLDQFNLNPLWLICSFIGWNLYILKNKHLAFQWFSSGFGISWHSCLHLRNACRASTTRALEALRIARSVPLEWPPRGMDRHIASIAISDIEPMEMENLGSNEFFGSSNRFFQLRQLMNYKKIRTGIVGKVI